MIAEVARRHDLAPQHLSNWIRAAKDGRFALPGDVTFVPVVAETLPPPVAAALNAIEIAIGQVVVRVPFGIDARTLEIVLRAVKRSAA